MKKHINKLKRKFLKVHYDTIAYEQINSIINCYLPFSSSAIRPAGLKLILNDIIVNNRKVIFEIGSGISTVLLEALTRHYPIKIYSLDHSKNWQDIVKKMINNNNGDTKNITWIHTEMKDINIDNYKGVWYDFEIVKSFLTEPIDQLIVDGPISIHGQEKIRYPALPYFQTYLAKNHSIFLDDTHRKQEKLIATEWAKQYSLQLNDYTVYSDMSILFSGEIYNIF